MRYIQALRHFTTFAYGRYLAKENVDLAQLLSLSSPIYRLELVMIGRLFARIRSFMPISLWLRKITWM